MEKQKICMDSSTYKEYVSNHEKLLNQPVMKSFLTSQRNLLLFTNFICHQSFTNKKNLDEAFRLFYFEVRLISYLSKLIYYYSIDLNKRYRRYYNRHVFILDKPVNQEETTALIDFYKHEEPDIEHTISNNPDKGLLDCIEHKKLYIALQSLTNKQLKVLELIYVKQFTNKSIAELFGETPQNISKIHLRALRNIRGKIGKESLHG